MNKFFCTVVDSSGKILEIEKECINRDSLEAWCVGKRYIIKGIKEEVKGERKNFLYNWGERRLFKGRWGEREGRWSLEEEVEFTDDLLQLVESGIPIARACVILESQVKSGKMKLVIRGINEHIGRGNLLSEALNEYEVHFSKMYRCMIGAGERSGRMESVLKLIVGIERRLLEVQRKVKSAIIYPLFVLIVAVIVIGLLIVCVIPGFYDTLISVTTVEELPVLTKIIFEGSFWIKENIMKWMVIGVVGGVGIGVVMSRKKGREGGAWKYWSGWDFIPVVKRVRYYYEQGRVASLLGVMISGNIDLRSALDVILELGQTKKCQRAVGDLKKYLSEGNRFSKSLEKTKFFDEKFVASCEIAEETGLFEYNLNQIAHYYYEKLDRELNKLTKLLEPILLTILTVIIGVIMIGLLLPIFQTIEEMSGG